MKKRRVRRFFVLLMLGFVLVAGTLLSLEVPYRGFSGPTYVKFDRGAGTLGMARALEQSGVIRYAWQFWLARALSPSAKLAAGEYRFDRPAGVFDVFGRIAHGDVYFLELTIPEGSNMFDIARLAQAAGVMNAQDFLHAARNPASIRDLDPAASRSCRRTTGCLPWSARSPRVNSTASIFRSQTDQAARRTPPRRSRG